MFVVFPYYPFNVHGDSGDVPSFISDAGDLHLLLPFFGGVDEWVAYLEVYQFY